MSICGGLLAAPSIAHDTTSVTHNWTRHYRPLAKKIFYTKRQANTRFINVGEQASNAGLLDGLDSTSFASSSHVHSGADITSGTVAEARIVALLARDSEVFGIVTAADGAASGLDADLLDGMDSGAFAVAGLTDGVQWFKDGQTSSRSPRRRRGSCSRLPRTSRSRTRSSSRPRPSPPATRTTPRSSSPVEMRTVGIG